MFAWELFEELFISAVSHKPLYKHLYHQKADDNPKFF